MATLHARFHGGVAIITAQVRRVKRRLDLLIERSP
jgi:hypothetical protein